MKPQKLVCACKQVTEKEILSVLKKNVSYGLAEIKLATGASTGCGRCATEIKALVDANRKGHPSTQLDLFGFGDNL